MSGCDSSRIEVAVEPQWRVSSGNPACGASGDDSCPFRRWFPWIVPGFVVANIVIFAVTMYVNDCPRNSGYCVLPFLGRFSFESLKMNPLLGPSASTLNKMGAMLVSKVVIERQGWRLITCSWLHAGVLHVLSNMLSLLFIGIRLEQEFGYARIGLLYSISGFGGSIMSALFIQSSISVGASAALFGLLGSMLSELLTNWTIYSNKLTTLLTLLLIIAINLAIGILPHVDNFAHIGGFLSGFLLGFVFLIRPQFAWLTRKNAALGSDTVFVKCKHSTYQYVMWIVSVFLLLAGFSAGVIMLFQGVDANAHCSWCHYLSCLPTSKWSCNPEASCMTYELGNRLKLICVQTGKTQSFRLRDAPDDLISLLCAQLCSNVG